MVFTVYGIPSCSTVGKARAWLLAHGAVHTFVDFRVERRPRAQVAAWVKALGASTLRNTSGASYRALPAEKTSWSDDEWTTRFFDDPMLIKRPVIERDGVPVLAGFKGDDAALTRALGLPSR